MRIRLVALDRAKRHQGSLTPSNLSTTYPATAPKEISTPSSALISFSQLPSRTAIPSTISPLPQQKPQIIQIPRHPPHQQSPHLFGKDVTKGHRTNNKRPHIIVLRMHRHPVFGNLLAPQTNIYPNQSFSDIPAIMQRSPIT